MFWFYRISSDPAPVVHSIQDHPRVHHHPSLPVIQVINAEQSLKKKPVVPPSKGMFPLGTKSSEHDRSDGHRLPLAAGQVSPETLRTDTVSEASDSVLTVPRTCVSNQSCICSKKGKKTSSLTRGISVALVSPQKKKSRFAQQNAKEEEVRQGIIYKSWTA